MGSSSFTPRQYNRDGSRNIYCKKCLRLICSLASGQAGFGSAICAICNAELEGTELSAEIQDQLTGNIRLDSGFMVPSNVVLPKLEDMPKDPMTGKDGRASFMGYWVKVIKNAVTAARDVITDAATNKPKIPLSKQVAQEKKRKRVFLIEDAEATNIDREQAILDARKKVTDD